MSLEKDLRVIQNIQDEKMLQFCKNKNDEKISNNDHSKEEKGDSNKVLVCLNTTKENYNNYNNNLHHQNNNNEDQLNNNFLNKNLNQIIPNEILQQNKINTNSRNKDNNIDYDKSSVLNKSSLKKNQNQLSFDNKTSNNMNPVSQEIFGTWNQLNKNKSRNDNRNYLVKTSSVKTSSNGYNSEKVNSHLTGSYQKNLLLTQLIVKGGNNSNSKSNCLKKKLLMENTIKTQLLKKSEILSKNVEEAKFQNNYKDSKEKEKNICKYRGNIMN